MRVKSASPMKSPLVLGLETSCDETAVALYSRTDGLLDSRVRSQHARHAPYGGVVPELASREHLRWLLPMTDEMLREAGGRIPDRVAYTRGPGLASSLLCAAATGEALALAWGIPAAGVNHLEGHILSPLLENPAPDFPYVALLASGGHTQLWRARDFGDYHLLGQTMDDAAGEALDKTATLLGLEYPGGPALERLALQGDAARFSFSDAGKAELDFSFSGLKTAARRLVEKHPDARADIAASFQKTVARALAKRAGRALRQTGIRRLAATGGVAQNGVLTRALEEVARQAGAELFRPRAEFCADNAAMIALAGAHAKMEKSGGGFDIRPRWLPGE